MGCFLSTCSWEGFHFSRASCPILLGLFFLEDQKPGNGWLLKRTMAENNGESNARDMRFLFREEFIPVLNNMVGTSFSLANPLKK